MNPYKKRKIVKNVLIILSAILLFLTLCYTAIYAHWGKRHTVLYTVEKVYITADKENDNIYYLKYDVTAKNWIHDFSEKSYTLTPHMGGTMQSDYNFSGETVHVTVSHSKSRFSLNAQIDLSIDLSDDEKEINRAKAEALLEDLIYQTDFINYDFQDNYNNYSLYMNDNRSAQLIFDEQNNQP